MILKTLLILAASLSIASASEWSDYYEIENVEMPAGPDPQLGGVIALRDGRLAACFYRGEVMFYDPKSQKWSLYAQGLHCPLGLLEEDDGSLVVMQWAELTRLSDTDGDGLADHYQTVCDDFGISGNYHEFAYGPARDAEGNYYISLNVASNGAGIFKNVRGPFTPIGVERSFLEKGKKQPDWAENKEKAGRMYSRVAYRGCVIKVTPDGKSSPFAYGFRSPNGINFDEKGRLWVTDNQGDWVGTSPLYHVKEGGFYGHPASLVWSPGWTQDPLETPVETLKEKRTLASGLFPQGELANSPTQPINTIDPSKFGLPKGELLIGEMNQPTLVRFLAEEVEGFVQGAMIPFLTRSNIGIGNHRLTFTEDGDLWIAKTHLKWPGEQGLQRVSWNKKPLFLVTGVNLKPEGFEITFNRPIGKEDPQISISRHTYHYHAKYGSEKVDLQDVEITKTFVSDDRKSMLITLPRIDKEHLYTIDLENMADWKGQSLMGNVLRYNVVKVPTSLPAEVKNKERFLLNVQNLLAEGSLSQWTHARNDRSGRWTINDGVIYLSEERSGNLRTKKSFKNFDLSFEWKISEGGNSGIIYRMNRGRGLEYQLLDDERHVRGKTPNSSASALYDLAAPIENKPYKPAGQWNTGRIVVNGDSVEHWLNGEKMLSVTLGSAEWKEALAKSKYKDRKNHGLAASPIHIQDHASAVWLRNILITEL